jgi:hypothetical protein
MKQVSTHVHKALLWSAVCLSCFLISCTKQQNKTEYKRDSINQLSPVTTNKPEPHKRYQQLDRDTVTSEQEILLENEPHTLRIAKYCLNDSAINVALSDSEIYVTHTYSIQITLAKNQEVILDRKVLTSDHYGPLFEVLFLTAEANRLYFKTEFISHDSSSIDETGFSVFYQTKKKGQIEGRSPPILRTNIAGDLIFTEYSQDFFDMPGFVSLSDYVQFSNHSDSLIIPNLYYSVDNQPVGRKVTEKDRYIKLPSNYRERFLLKTGVSNTDKLFIYNYYHNTLDSFDIKDLTVVAVLDSYYSINDPIFLKQEDYHVGVEIEKSIMKKLGQHYTRTMTYLGRSNPFIQGRLKPVVWEEIEPSHFPMVPMSNKISLLWQKYNKREAYKYEADNFAYYVQELWLPGHGCRRILVINLQTKEVVKDLFECNSEGIRLASLSSNQWVGVLYKDKPPVLLGFSYYDE